ncbi:MAG: hypothetical protein M3Q46_12500 [Verrucomicrobiota bacterium]|nr:hypothetical protein [Verrucomicrobiota bacterium]
MFTTIQFRHQIDCGRAHFPVTAVELETLQTLGKEMGFSVEPTKELPDRASELGAAKPERQQLVKVVMLQKA